MQPNKHQSRFAQKCTYIFTLQKLVGHCGRAETCEGFNVVCVHQEAATLRENVQGECSHVVAMARPVSGFAKFDDALHRYDLKQSGLD